MNRRVGSTHYCQGQRARRGLNQSGFTLLEVVLVLVIMSLMAAVLVPVIAVPIEQVVSHTRRAELTDRADNIVRRIARDIRAALPNSLRVSADGQALELLLLADGGRYRATPGVNPNGEIHLTPEHWLTFLPDDSFNITGRLHRLNVAYGDTLPSDFRLAVYTVDNPQLWSDAAANNNDGVITAAGNTMTLTDSNDEDQIFLQNAHQFPTLSPENRAYVVAGAVQYRCDNGELTRYENFSASAAMQLPSDGDSAVLADLIDQCDFSYNEGSLSRWGVALLNIGMRADKEVGAAEPLRILHQVHVENTP